MYCQIGQLKIKVPTTHTHTHTHAQNGFGKYGLYNIVY